MVTIRTALVLTACLWLAGCGTTYVAQAAKGQLQILTSRQPIQRVLADPAADPKLKERLSVVREARAFASSELGLPNNKSYTAYADLRREFVVWSVVATPEFSVEPREWCFPIVGCVAYRGYFREASAEAFANTLRSQGLDTIVGGVPAYSTLGKFNDPILNTMMAYGDDELASIMFHELSHQLVYIPDDTSFNEAFAVTVEQEGLARWLKSRGREADLMKYQKRRARQSEGVALVARFRGELRSLYGMQIGPEVMRARKAQVFARLVAELRALDARFGTTSGLAAELDGRPNNARLASLATYYDCVPGFERLLSSGQHDLPRFYDAARALAKLPRDERRQRLCSSAPQSAERKEAAQGPEAAQ
jgi:predicted aminopeptidase